MINSRDIAVQLVEEAERNPASSAAFLILASRQRDRSTLTLSSLYNTMRREGFKYSRDQYVDMLKLLNKLEFGKLDLNRRGRIVGLKEISVRLTSIGKIACKEIGQVLLEKPLARHSRRLRPRPSVLKGVGPETVKKVVEAIVERPTQRPIVNTTPVDDNSTPVDDLSVDDYEEEDTKIILYIRGKPMTLILPKDFSGEDIAFVVSRLCK